MKLYLLNGLVSRRGGPRESVQVAPGMVVRVCMEGGRCVEGAVERVGVKAIRVSGVNFTLGDAAITSMVVLACESGLTCYDSATEEPMPSGHAWREETLREPTFGVAFGATRICRICGKRQGADYTAGRIGGAWVKL